MLYVHASGYVGGASVSELGLSGLEFTLQNQDDDYATIRFRHPWKGNPPAPFDVDREISFYENPEGTSLCFFRGTVAKPASAASGSTSSKTVSIMGPWAQFKTTPFVYMYPYVTGTAASTHGVIGGDVNSLLTTILSSNAAHLCSIGTINVGSVTLPTTDVYNQSLAQVIKSILRYIPDAIVYFDYTTPTRPTIHIRHSQNAPQGSADFGLGGTKDINVVPRHDRQVGGVMLQYEQARTHRVGRFVPIQNGYGLTVNTTGSPETTHSGFYLHATDSAGDMASRRLFRKTLRAEGAYDQTIYIWQGSLWRSPEVGSLHALAYPGSGVSGPGHWLWALKGIGGFMRLFSPSTSLHIDANADYMSYNANHSLFGTTSITSPNYLTGGTFYNDSLRPVIGFGPTWRTTPNLITSLGSSPAVQASSVPSVFFEGSNYVQAMTCTVNWNNFYQLRNPVGIQNFTAPNILFVQGFPSQDDFYFTKTVTTTSGGHTDGIAQKLLAANSRLMYDCSFTQLIPPANTLAWVLAYFSSVRVLTLNNFSNATTPIQRVRINAFSRSYSVDCGAPEQLGPQDLIALAKAGEAL